MTKKIINTGLLIFCCIHIICAAPSLVFASSTFKRESISSYSTGTDIDFSGVWKSDRCINEQPMTLSIVQDNQDYIQINRGKISLIGALQTTAISSSVPREHAPGGDIYSIDWNSEKTELILRGIFVDKSSEEAKDNYLSSMIQYTTFALNKEGQLLLKTKAVLIRNLEVVHKWDSPACIFNKVTDVPELNSFPNFSPIRFHEEIHN